MFVCVRACVRAVERAYVRACFFIAICPPTWCRFGETGHPANSRSA